MYITRTLILLAAAASTAFGHPYFVYGRDDTTINPAAITGTECGDPSVNIAFHDQNVAELAICGGIAGTIEFCGGNPATTVGESGTAQFTLAAPEGATINVSKGRWEGCVRAARAVCPTGELAATCVGGVTSGAGFDFMLTGSD